MKVFKFGGASVKDPSAVKNVSKILSLYKGEEITVIVSAMGKTTNSLELIVDALWNRNELKFNQLVDERLQFHLAILNGLFSEKHYSIYKNVEDIFETLKKKYNLPISENYDFEYDQIVSLGEVVSSLIVTSFLKEEGHSVEWADCRQLIRTNNLYREGNVDWSKTQELVQARFIPMFKDSKIIIELKGDKIYVGTENNFQEDASLLNNIVDFFNVI